MKWLLFGHRGWIGAKVEGILRAAKQEVSVVDRRMYRYEDAAGVINAAKADRVVCAVGRTHTKHNSTIDGLEGDASWDDAVLANHDIPVWISRAARGKAHVLYIGTGCIYSGRHEYFEYDRPDFSGSAYSRIKSMTDLTLGLEENVLNARIRMPISAEASPRDFVCKLLSYSLICSDGANSMSVLSEVLPVLLALAHEGVVGTLNAVNPGPLTNAEVLDISRESAMLAHPHRDTTQPEDLKLLARRSCCILSCEKIQGALQRLSRSTLRNYGAPEQLSPARELLAKTLISRKEPFRLLVTGGCGFIGSHFIDMWLSKFPQDIIVNVDSVCAVSGASPGNVDSSSDDRYTHVNIDIRSAEAAADILALLTSQRITHVIHFAALTHVDDSFASSCDFVHTNVLGTHHLLEAMRQYGSMVRFLHVSTDEVYGDRRGDDSAADSTTTPLCPTNPYSASKASAEMLVKAYRSSYELPCTVVRCNNVYGPRQHDTKVVAKFCTMALRGDDLTLYDGGKSRRHFVYVSDAVVAIGILLRSGDLDGKVYNVASDQDVSIAELARHILALACRPTNGTTSVEGRPYDDMRYLVCDADTRSLGWRQTVPLEDGLAKTFRWYAERHRRESTDFSSGSQANPTHVFKYNPGVKSTPDSACLEDQPPTLFLLDTHKQR